MEAGPTRPARLALPALLVMALVIAPAGHRTNARGAAAEDDWSLQATAPVAALSTGGATGLPRVTFLTGKGGSILVHGTYPQVSSPCVRPVPPILHARYAGAIEVGKDRDGHLFVIATMSLEDYLLGIAEVPRTWPVEALKAQVVAARSYALAHLSAPDPTGEALGYQLCATDACQVYRGLGVAGGPFGGRWRAAVEATGNQVLMWNGRPADTLYFSTSNGHTYGNDVVFGSAPLPYLRGVPETDDGSSSLSHWQATVALPDAARFLREAGDWGTQKLSSVGRSGDEVVLRGGGASATLSRSDFRSDLNAWGHCLEPDRYPASGLPQTVPSKWFDASVSKGSVVLTGRGWGHGVGMVQWGAEGKAARGLSYREILSYYYGGLKPKALGEESDIRVGIAVGLKSVTVSATGPVTAQGTAVSTGPWLVRGGKRLRVSSGGPPPQYISPGSLKGPRKARSGHTVKATLLLPQLSVVHLALRAGGRDVALSSPVTRLPGTVKLSGTVPPMPTGRYPLQAVVTDGTDIVRASAPDAVRVRGTGREASPRPSPAATPTPSANPPARAVHRAPAGAPFPPGVAVALAGLPLAAAAIVLAVRRRRRRRASALPRTP